MGRVRFAPMRLPYVNRLWIVALAGGLLLTACGGKGGGAAPAVTTTTSPLAGRTAFVTSINSLCKQFIGLRQPKVDGFLAAHQVTDQAAARDFLVNDLAPLYDSFVGAVHRQMDPAQDTTEWDKIVESIDTRLGTFKQQIGTDPANAITVD